MIESDFEKYGIIDFTPDEVRRTGARLRDVKVYTMIRLQNFRTAINRRVGLLINGLTTGSHLSYYHPIGEAVDCHLYVEDGTIKASEIIQMALISGFMGIGIYFNHNTKMYSFHMDLRQLPKFWGGMKILTANNWEYFPLLVDPSEHEIF